MIANYFYYFRIQQTYLSGCLTGMYMFEMHNSVAVRLTQ